MSIRISDLSIQTSDVLLFIILGFAGVIIYSTKTFFDVLIKRITCRVFDHDFKIVTTTSDNFLKCQRCKKESLDFTRYRPKENEK